MHPSIKSHYQQLGRLDLFLEQHKIPAEHIYFVHPIYGGPKLPVPAITFDGDDEKVRIWALDYFGPIGWHTEPANDEGWTAAVKVVGEIEIRIRHWSRVEAAIPTHSVADLTPAT